MGFGSIQVSTNKRLEKVCCTRLCRIVQNPLIMKVLNALCVESICQLKFPHRNVKNNETGKMVTFLCYSTKSGSLPEIKVCIEKVEENLIQEKVIYN